jgi:hypothetical protein
LDHVCCIIERELKAEMDFEELYQQAIATFYKTDLSELESETAILLNFKNLTTMKNSMILSGLFSAAIMLLGILFKIMHFPGAAVILPVGILTCSFVFIPLLAYLKLKEDQTTANRIVVLATALAGSLLLTGITSKLIANSGSALFAVLFYSSAAVMFGLSLPVYLYNGIRNPATKLNTVVTSIIVLMVFALLLSMTYRSL